MLKLSNKLVLIIFFLLFEVEDLTARESSEGQDLKELDSKILKLKSGISRICLRTRGSAARVSSHNGGGVHVSPCQFMVRRQE